MAWFKLHLKKILAATGIIGVAFAEGLDQTPSQPEVENMKIDNSAPSGRQAAIIKDGEVINYVVLPLGWPNVSNPWQPPAGTEVIFTHKAGIEDKFDGKDFYREEIKQPVIIPIIPVASTTP